MMREKHDIIRCEPPHAARSRQQPARATLRGLDSIRREYFATSWEVATRYGVDFERVIVHLWGVRRNNHRFTIRQVVCLDDLVQAVACIDQVGLAWTDLAEGNERALVRACRWMPDEISAMLCVRRLLADIRKRNQNELADDRRPSMRDYTGAKPLRNWLIDRLNGSRPSSGVLASRGRAS